MVAPFDIFRTEADGTLRWFGAASDLDIATKRVRELATSSPGNYFVFSQTTGNKLKIKPESPDEPAEPKK